MKSRIYKTSLWAMTKIKSSKILQMKEAPTHGPLTEIPAISEDQFPGGAVQPHYPPESGLGHLVMVVEV